MKHKTLRCTAETAALLLTVAMLAFLIAGLHQHDPDRVLSTLTTGWYQLTDGVRLRCSSSISALTMSANSSPPMRKA